MSARCDRVLYHRLVTSAHDSYSCCDVLVCVPDSSAPSVRQNTDHVTVVRPRRGTGSCQ